jgi:hypothetical protein
MGLHRRVLAEVCCPSARTAIVFAYAAVGSIFEVGWDVVPKDARLKRLDVLAHVSFRRQRVTVGHRAVFVLVLVGHDDVVLIRLHLNDIRVSFVITPGQSKHH